METIYLGLGSNIEAPKHLRMAVRELDRRFTVVRRSSVYSSAAVGFDGDDFLNLVVAAQTAMTPAAIVRELEQIHALAGRRRGSARFAPRELDIDLLLYGRLCLNDGYAVVPRDDVLEYAFVLLPLAEIAPDLVHPVTGRTIADHCQDLDLERQLVHRTDIEL